jgi:hypothetical protein
MRVWFRGRPVGKRKAEGVAFLLGSSGVAETLRRPAKFFHPTESSGIPQHPARAAVR